MKAAPDSPRPQKGVFTRYIWIVLVLVILPGISWFYLKNGFEYQKRVRSELKSFGPVQAFAFEGWNQDSLSDHLTIISFPAADGDGEVLNEALHELHSQFDQSSEMRFISLFPADSAAAITGIDSLRSLDPAQWKWIQAPAAEIDALRSRLLEQAKMPQSSPDHILLADSKGLLREAYDMGDVADIRRLIEHVAMLAPRDADEHIEIKRTPER